MINSLLQLGLTTSTSFLICFFAIPSIIKVAELKNLYDEPCERKKHTLKVPTLGGIAIFAGYIFSAAFWSNQNQIVELQYIICSTILLFFIGIKDDIINLVAHKKLMGQIVAALLLIFFADIRLTSLYGIFNIYTLPYAASASLSLITIIGITNSLNLIDGVDTLAGSVGVVLTLSFGTWFFLSENQQYAIISFSMLGSLLAFLHFNKTPARIFMGDTGSLVLGLTASVLAIKFIELNRSYIGPEKFKLLSVPALAIAVLIIPIFDTCRVFTIRILQGRSPLHPDRNHLHHILTDIGYTHLKSSCILVLLNLFIILISFNLQSTPGEAILSLNFLIASIFTFYFTRKRRKLFKFSEIKMKSDEDEKDELINFDSNIQ